MMVYPPRAVGDAVRSRANALGVPFGEYIASVLAERFGHPYWAAPEVRLVEGGLAAMLGAAGLESYVPENDSWDDRDVFVTKPVKALGQIVRDYAKREGRTITSIITDELAHFHGIDLEHRMVIGMTVTDPLGIEAEMKRRQGVQRMLA